MIILIIAREPRPAPARHPENPSLAELAPGGRPQAWGGPIMLLFLCDYAIFYAPIMPLYAHIYAPNYADYAQIMQLCSNYANYAKICSLC